MAQKTSDCPHVNTIGFNTWEDIQRKKAQDQCDSCDAAGPNLWLCLYDQCLYVGCGESNCDHSSIHAQEKSHPLTMNMTTLRIWCYTCDCEVYKNSNSPPLQIMEQLSLASVCSSLPDRYAPPHITPPRCPTPTHEESDSDDDDDDTKKPRGLTGLQNIGNTCYMNSALQALANCQPMTKFFLDCSGYVKTDKKPMLSRCYMKLMSEMWHRKRPSYLVPSSVAHSIKVVHPMFRGYTQQDAQEFLRCFMDQIHEELKQPIVIPDDDMHAGDMTTEDQEDDSEEHCSSDEEEENSLSTMQSSPLHKSKQAYYKMMKDRETKVEVSDGEYETCDSGLSSNRNSTDPSLSSSDEASPENSDNTLQEAGGETMDSDGVALHPGTNQNLDGPDVCHPELESRQENGEVDDGAPSCNCDAADSGIGSVSSSTLVSSNSSMSGCISDAPFMPMGLPSRSKDNKELANKQEQQHRQETDSQPMMGVLEGELSTLVDVEPLQIQRFTSLGKRPRGQCERRPRSRSSSDISQGHSPTGRGKSGKKKLPEYQSVISDIFDGKILSSVQCLTCERISCTKETFQDLSLPIPSKDYLHALHNASQGGGVSQKGTCGEVHLNQGWLSWLLGWVKSWFWGPTITLSDCLATFFSADELKGDNMYSCEQCKKLRNGMKYSKVLKLPEILCIHLKRFRHEFMFSSKISSYVSFPLEDLDMGPYLHKNCKDQVTKYDLVSVICHHGVAGGGHYTTYAQNYINSQWYEFDDQYVTEVDLQQVENAEAYVLFYRKQNDHMIPIRQKAERIAENLESTFLQFFISKQWINKFNTFAEPGPITNSDFLCHHGGVHPHKWSSVEELIQEIPPKLWEYLHDMFGGGPAVNRLYPCSDCQVELDRLKMRQRKEMDVFQRLLQMFQCEDYSGRIYAVNMAWFKEWESFVRAKTNELPGPIDNNKICITRGGQSALRINSDYVQLSEEQWGFLYSIYGGGPEIVVRQPHPPSPIVTAHKTDDASARISDIKA